MTRSTLSRRNAMILVAVAVPVLVVSACSSTKSVSKTDVETQSQQQLSATVGSQVPAIVCPGDLEAKVGTVIVCSITSAESGAVYDVTITVTSVDESTGNAKWDIKVADQPRGSST
ncbi:MAG: DUF4333 domain-containing protein [Actinobacteria bacterium]|nr:DUF4333 domain-containing protein [Actinomycetota bacterium]